MKVVILLLILFLLFVAIGCKRIAEPGTARASSAPAPAAAFAPDAIILAGESRGIRTEKVESRALFDYLELGARVQADPTRLVRVFPPVSGRVLSISVRPGDHVRQGQTLALLQSSEAAAARADYEKARAEAQRADTAAKRTAFLFENQVIAEKDYQVARAQAEMAQSELARTQQRLNQLGVDSEGRSDQVPVLSPRASVVLDIGAASGELSKSLDSASPICTLADLSRVWVVGDLYEKDLAGIGAGTAATVAVSAYPGAEWHSTVANVSAALDPATRTLKLRVVLPNPDERLKPEMFATLRLRRSDQLTNVIPSAAVLREGGTASVFVQESPGRYRRRVVRLGRSLDGHIEVTSGLVPGELVVAEGAALVRAAVM